METKKFLANTQPPLAETKYEEIQNWNIKQLKYGLDPELKKNQAYFQAYVQISQS